MFWHKYRHSKRAQNSQYTQQRPQNTTVEYQRVQEQPQNVQQQVQNAPQPAQTVPQQPQNAQQSSQNIPQQPQKPQYPAHSKPKSSHFSRQSRPVYTTSPLYVESNTVYYIVQEQPTTPYYVQQRPQYVVQKPYYDRKSHLGETALLLGAGLILGGIIF